MSEKHVVVQGGMCECKYGNAPDTLQVISHKFEFVNDKNGAEKPVLTTMDIGQPLQAKTFGPCKLQPIPGGYKPCQPAIIEWKGFYKNVQLKNGGNIIQEDSTATCAIAGAPCITITDHGQVAAPSQQNIDNANKDIQGQLNPMVNVSTINQSHSANGVIEKGI